MLISPLPRCVMQVGTILPGGSMPRRSGSAWPSGQFKEARVAVVTPDPTEQKGIQGGRGCTNTA